MRKYLKLIGLLMIMLVNSPAFSQTFEKLSVIISDQNGDLITVGVVSLFNSDRIKIAEIEFVKDKKIPVFNLEIGFYVLEIQSPGFKTSKTNVEIKSGQNIIEVQLLPEDIKVDVEVGQSAREKRLEEVFGGFLSKEEIAALPETGEEIKEELKRRFGDDVLIQIDGDFNGSHIPSREEIASIKVIRNAFDAEFHEIARIIIDIRTKVIASKFGGFVNYSFNNSNLNARNPFHLRRLPENRNNLLLSLSGPIIKNKTAFSFSTFGIYRTNTQNFIGSGFGLQTFEPQKIGQNIVFNTFSVKHNLPKEHLLELKYQHSVIKFTNLGLGSLDLPERGATRNDTRHRFTVSESGTFKKKFANELRVGFFKETEEITPNSDDVTIIISNAYNKGGFGTNNQNVKNGFFLSDNLLFDAGKHSLKIGAEIEYENLESLSKNNLNGTFVFANLNDFQNQRPRQYSRNTSATAFNLSQLKTSAYFQDYTSIGKSLQISLGVRYEWQNNLNDYNNFSPRLGYVWSPEKSGKMIIRGGFGVFYDWLNTQIISSVLSNDGRQGQKLIIINPGFPNPNSGGTVSTPLAPSISKIAENLQSPSILVTQNAVNYKLTKTTTFEGIYTYRKGLHHFRSRDINAPIDGIRQNRNFGVVQFLESSGTTIENSFELKTNSFYKGVNLYANYKLSKSVSDFFGALSLPTDNYDLRRDRSVTNLDQTHKLNLGITFDLWKNLNVAPTFVFDSGFPYRTCLQLVH